ncbi:MAG TPA: energy transducer TonB [Vicinamibacterales bacterium]|jgi:protein TonB|nr:energy transducer TonB [Vicinamibacterales bacterium]
MRFICCTVAAGLMLLAGALQAQEPRVYEVGNGVSRPKVETTVKADYTGEAKAAGIQGTVLLSTVVRPDGTVGEVKVTKSLDAERGLDQQAVRAMKQWTFTPGTKDGTPVAVRVSVEMTFALK